jgi:hypothetical protein
MEGLCRLEEAEPILRTQFSYTGKSVENGMGLIEESRSSFKYFCTGRRFLTRFVADLEVRVALRGGLLWYSARKLTCCAALAYCS